MREIFSQLIHYQIRCGWKGHAHPGNSQPAINLTHPVLVVTHQQNKSHHHAEKHITALLPCGNGVCIRSPFHLAIQANWLRIPASCALRSPSQAKRTLLRLIPTTAPGRPLKRMNFMHKEQRRSAKLCAPSIHGGSSTEWFKDAWIEAADFDQRKS